MMKMPKCRCPLCHQPRTIVQGSKSIPKPGPGMFPYPAVFIFRCGRCKLEVTQDGVPGNLDVERNRAALRRFVERLGGAVLP